MSESKKKNQGQLQLDIEREKQLDRNHSVGGRSFYFFDFDDNIAYLKTSIYLFHKETNNEIALSSGEFARLHHLVGKHGELKDYKVEPDDPVEGSFRDFRDRDIHTVTKVLGGKQVFVQDVMDALGLYDYQWKGPSWDCFYHAVFNQRPISVITARGHQEETIRDGISQFVLHEHLPNEPNYLSIFPVSHPETRDRLAGIPGTTETSVSVPELKKKAIHASVEEAFKNYGENEHHRFGMSDDDPNNIDLIIEAMTELKKEFPENGFFVFDSSNGRLLKREIFETGVKDEEIQSGEQLSLLKE